MLHIVFMSNILYIAGQDLATWAGLAFDYSDGIATEQYVWKGSAAAKQLLFFLEL